LDNNRNGVGIGYEFPSPPGPDATISAADILCAESSGNAASGPEVDGYLYEWTLEGGSIDSGQGTAVISYTVGTDAVLTLSLTVTDPTTGFSRTRQKTVDVVTEVTCFVSGRPSTCAGATDNLYSSAATPGATHSWSISGNGEIVGPTDLDYVNVTAGEVGSFTITDTVTLNGGCQCVSEVEVPVNTPIEPPDITADPDPVPAESTSGYAYTNVVGFDYTWEIEHGTIQGSDHQSEVYYTAADFGQVLIKLTITDIDGCSASSTIAVPIDAPNADPVGNPDLLIRQPGQSITVPESELLPNDTDREEGTLTVTEVTQPGGGVVTLMDGQITYTPNPGSHFEDQFNYTITDSQGGTATSLVTVTIRGTLSILDAPTGNGVVLDMYGAGGAFYVLEWTTAFEEPWQGLTTLFTDENGHAQFTHDSSVDPPRPLDKAFYRLNR
jgi:hypothetical protein